MPLVKFRAATAILLAQAAAIILPVAVLAGIALSYLHEDKAAIDQEARAGAQKALEKAAAWLPANLQSRIDSGISAAITEGQPVISGDYPQVPQPAGPSESTAALRQLEAAEKAGARDLVDRAMALARRAHGATTEAGLPVSGLAILLALRHIRNGVVPLEIFSELERPSILTPELLRAVAGVPGLRSPAHLQQVRQDFEREETKRSQMRAVIRSVAARLVGEQGPSSFRVGGPAGNWLALCDPMPDGWKITLVNDFAPQPSNSYLGLTLDLDQAHWRLEGSPAGVPKVLASLAGTLNGHPYTLAVDLARPEQLYGPYDRRQRIIEALIFCAAGTALLGLFSLWKGYHRQARLSEMKSGFVSSVSHELRAPLAAVRLMAESLESGRVSDEQKRQDYYRLIVQECRRLSSLVENVLDLSRIGSGRKIYEFEHVDVPALLRHSVALMEPFAAERNVKLRLADLDAGAAEWDGHAVEQSLVNLLDNAIKHSPEGAEVTVTLERQPGQFRVWVEDHGPGIPEREQKRIFEMFYRHGTELRRQTKGTGIGLSIVRHLAEAHGGRVLVESQPGRGSRFALELPVERPR